MSSETKVKVDSLASVAIEDPKLTIQKLTEETMQHLIRVGDPNLAKWGYSLMRSKVEDYWKGIAHETLQIKRKVLARQKAYPSLQKKKKQETLAKISKSTIRITEEEIFQRLSDNKLLKKRPLIISKPK